MEQSQFFQVGKMSAKDLIAGLFNRSQIDEEPQNNIESFGVDDLGAYVTNSPNTTRKN